MKETKTGAKSFFLQKPEENKRNDTAQEREIERERVKWQRDHRHVLKALLFLIHAHNTEREASRAITKHYRTEKDSFWRIIHY